VGILSRKTVAWAAGGALAVGGCTAGIVVAVNGASGSGSGGTPAVPAAHAAATTLPLRVVSISPVSGERAVNGAGNITVTYNRPLPASAPLPTLSPSIAGSWERKGHTVVFTPATGFPAGTHVTVTAGTGGSGTRSESSSFKTGKYSTLRLEEILAQLGYLPLTWTPTAGTVGEAGAATVTGLTSPAAELSAAYAPPAGTFEWRPGYPPRLHSFWTPGKANMLDRGAITGFEADHKLPTDGVAGPAVWKALLAAAVAGTKNTHGYSYAIASERLPETLTIWHDGRKVFSSPANTGIGVAPTALGTYPVYEKLQFQIMQGTNPDGSHYADPVSWVSYFNGGDAVHYFARGSYGSPQSLGCVELPYTAAKRAYPYLPYGTLVTVTA
jgi:peptidoglycan hydrolase-like protein with peptidoglycan-binding domain